MFYTFCIDSLYQMRSDSSLTNFCKGHQRLKEITSLPSEVGCKHVIAMKDYSCGFHACARDQKMGAVFWYYRCANSFCPVSLILSGFWSPSACRESPDYNILWIFPPQDSLVRKNHLLFQVSIKNKYIISR